MALTRKMLKEFGIDTEKIDLIIEAHSETVDSLKEERDKYKTESDQLKGLKDELKTVKEELKTAKENAGNESEWKEKFDKVSADFETYKSEQAEKESKKAINDAYRKLLIDAGISEKRVDSVIKVTDLSNISIDENGAIVDAENLTESIKSDWADFITTTNTNGANVPTPPKSEPRKDLGELSIEDYIMARKKM